MQSKFVWPFQIHEFLYWTYLEKLTEIVCMRELIIWSWSYSRLCSWTNFGIWDYGHQVRHRVMFLSLAWKSVWWCWFVCRRALRRNFMNWSSRNWKWISTFQRKANFEPPSCSRATQEKLGLNLRNWSSCYR